MPTPAKAWIMQLRRQKQTPDVHWVSWLPMKHYRRNTWTPWLWTNFCSIDSAKRTTLALSCSGSVCP